MSNFIKTFILSLVVTTSALAQLVDHVDRSYGVEGSCIFEAQLWFDDSGDWSIDSEGAFYILNNTFNDDNFPWIDSIQNSFTHRITKDGLEDLEFKAWSEAFSEKEFLYQKDDFFYLLEFIDASATNVSVYDFDRNLVFESVRIIEEMHIEDLYYDPSGFLLGVLGNGSIFKMSETGTLDNTFGTGGILDLVDVIGSSSSLTDLLHLHLGNYYFSVDIGENIFIVALDKNGKLVYQVDMENEFGLTNELDDLNFNIDFSTCLQNDQLLLSLNSYKSFVYDYYLVKLNSDLTVDRSFAENGMFSFPENYAAPFVVGEFSTSQILLRSEKDRDDIEFLAIMEPNGSIRYDIGNNSLLDIDIGFETEFVKVDNDDIYLLFKNSSGNNYLIKVVLGAFISETNNPDSYSENTFLLYPNPISSTQSLSLLYTGPALHNVAAIVTDICGNKVSEQYIPQLHKAAIIELQGDLTSGIYQVRILGDQIDTVLRFVVD